MDHKNTVVLYFTRTAREEARKKSFIRNGYYAQNKAIAQKLIDHTFKTIRASGLPFRVITSARQHGQSFGEKFANAFQKLFDEGFENVIAIGNDCMQLSQDDLTDASALLQKKALVAGPTEDGGAYLLGIHRSAFHKNAFCKLSWETDRLMEDFKNYSIHFRQQLAWLSQSVDIDNEDVLRHFLRRAASLVCYRRLIQFIQSILSSIIPVFQRHQAVDISSKICVSLSHRGPPAR